MRWEERFLLDEAPDAIMALGVGDEIEFWSRGAERLFGFTAEEARQRRPEELIVSKRFAQEWRRGLERARTSGEALEAECRARDGRAIYVAASARRLPTGDGGLVLTMKDITHLKVDRDARRLQERYGGLLESTPDAIVIVDQAGRIVLVNGQAEELFGYGRARLMGAPVELLVPERFRETHLRERDEYLEDPKRRTMGAGLELTARRSDGSVFPVEVSLSPLETSEGLLVMSALRDLTERRRADQRFRDVLELAPDAIVIVDAQGRILLVNSQAEKLFGYSREELLNGPLEVLIPERYRQTHPPAREGFFRSPTLRPMGVGLELYGLRKDGTEFPVEISLSPLETEEGTLAMSSIRDVTESRSAQAALKQAVGELESFAYSISHDLRAPLRTIDGFSQALQEDFAPALPPEAQSYVEWIRQGTRNMSRLIDDLLRFSHLGRQPMIRQPVDMVALVREVADGLDLGGTLTLDTLPPCHGDPALLRQVWTNLLSNAAKYSRNSAPPRIQVDFHEGAYRVRDNGVGFDMRFAHKLFGVFQRLHAVEEFEGTGVGLAIAQRIVQRHGGTIRAESEPGRGATFSFSIGGGTGP